MVLTVFTPLWFCEFSRILCELSLQRISKMDIQKKITKFPYTVDGAACGPLQPQAGSRSGRGLEASPSRHAAKGGATQWHKIT